jgi:hypothetical protein
MEFNRLCSNYYLVIIFDILNMLLNKAIYMVIDLGFLCHRCKIVIINCRNSRDGVAPTKREKT